MKGKTKMLTVGHTINTSVNKPLVLDFHPNNTLIFMHNMFNVKSCKLFSCKA